jgi:saccharopine dehydrogenase (NAD+, L-lysine-forming)
LEVIILGGYGAMAQSTVPDLLESPGVERVGIAGRNLEKAKAFAKSMKDDRAVPLRVDARDQGALVKELQDWGAVINSAWYDLNVPITEAAIEAGIHYIDLGGLYHQTLRQLKLDKAAKDAGVTCVLGIGSTPGTMNVMGMYGASKLDKVHKMQLRSSGAVVEGGEPGKFVPPYAIRTIFDEFSMDAPILRNGKIKFVPALSGLERIEFEPPVGVVEGYYTIHSELVTMPTTIGKGIQELDFIVAFPHEFTQTIATLVRLGLASREQAVVEGQKVRPYDVTSTTIDNLPKPKEPEKDLDIQRVVIHGEKDGQPVTLRYEAATWPHKKWNVGGGTVDTGVPPSIAAQWLLKGKTKERGTIPPEIAFEPLSYFKDLNAQGRGIKVVEYSETARQLN